LNINNKRARQGAAKAEAREVLFIMIDVSLLMSPFTAFSSCVFRSAERLECGEP
jgi:hypothetical protein